MIPHLWPTGTLLMTSWLPLEKPTTISYLPPSKWPNSDKFKVPNSLVPILFPQIFHHISPCLHHFPIYIIYFPHTFTIYFHVAGANPAREGALLPGRYRLRGDGHREFFAGQQRAAATGREEPGPGQGHGGPRGHGRRPQRFLFDTGANGMCFLMPGPSQLRFGWNRRNMSIYVPSGNVT